MDFLTIKNINISSLLQRVEESLKNDPKISLEMKAMLELLVLVITLLVEKLGLNSKNSSLPPSKDPNRKRKKSENPDRKPGGQNGHIGTTLAKVNDPDRIELINVDRNTLDHQDFTDVGYEARQVVEIVVSKEVIEYRAQVLQDKDGNRVVAPFPANVSRPIQYGASVKAQAVYMSIYQMLPFERTCDYFRSQAGIPISAGTLVNFNAEAFDLLETYENLVKKQIVSQSVLHADETGINIGGKTVWLHGLSNEKWTFYSPHLKRGGEGITDSGILGEFKGILCHDHWKAYFKLSCLHSLCNAHHIRELERVWEFDKLNWAKEMQELLLEMNKAKKELKYDQWATRVEGLVARYKEVLEKGELECPKPPEKQPNKKGRVKKTKSRNLLERLKAFEAETLRFLHNPEVPFTNNQGERDLRMIKVQQKISGCFKSMETAKIFLRIRSYLSTCQKNDVDPSSALRLLFSGKLPDFLASL